MTRPIPQKDPDGVARLAQLAKDAKERMPRLVREVEGVIAGVDPIELLSLLTVLYQTHRADEQLNRDETAQWQARIEWLSWLIFTRRSAAPAQPQVLDSALLAPLEAALRQYHSAATLASWEKDAGLSDEQEEFVSLIRSEALHVRGEAYSRQIEDMAIGVYGPHGAWCEQNLGFTVHDAFAIAWEIMEGFNRRLQSLRDRQFEIAQQVAGDATSALTLKLPGPIHDELARGAVPQDDTFAASIAAAWLSYNCPDAVGFSVDQLVADLDDNIDRERVVAFLEFASWRPDEINGEPTLLALPPLAKRPLIVDGGRFFLFAPGLLMQSISYGLHARLFADKRYRKTYDDARADWLEQSTFRAFRQMLPKGQGGWGLAYGPKKTRWQIDGLIHYDNKLILIECKWKRPTLSTLGGDLTMALKDLDAAILQPLNQAKRARAWIQQNETADFIEESTGRRLTVRRADVSEVFLVTLVGSDAWALIAANLARVAPLGMFSDGEYPWAVSLNDLRVVAELLATPSELFDYLRRRYDAQRQSKFMFHDEWDLLGVYRSMPFTTIHGMDDVPESERVAVEERAAIHEFEANLSRQQAETLALAARLPSKLPH